jgi:hypothetical protein
MMKRNVVIALSAIVVITAFVFRRELNDTLSCWAYHDQCTAKRISGLSSDDCLKRADAVAYLQEGGVCLVKAN